MKMHPAMIPSALAVLPAEVIQQLCDADDATRVDMLEQLLRSEKTSAARRELNTLLQRSRLQLRKANAKGATP